MSVRSGPCLRRLIAATAALAVLFSTASLGSVSARSPVTAGEARAEAARLIERVRRVTEADPSDAGAVPAWREASTGEPLLVETLDGRPSEYVVPVKDKYGKVISTIGVSAGRGVWHWYSKHYPFEQFPPVSAGEALKNIRGFLRQKGVSVSVPRPEARTAPDREVYWHFKFGHDLPFSEVYLSAFTRDRPYTNLEVRPWNRARGPGKSVNHEPGKSYADGGQAAAGRANTPAGAVPAEYNIQDVPYHQQETSWWCGPASLEMMFDYEGPDVPQQEIAWVANASQQAGGVTDYDLLRAGHFSSQSASIQNPSLRGYTGRPVGYGVAAGEWRDGTSLFQSRYSDLKRLVSQDRPVLVLTWYDGTHTSGHFRVVKGYSDNTGVFIFHDPWYSGTLSGPDCALNQSFFVDDLWNYSDRWGMTAEPWTVSVSKPESVTAGEVFQVDALVSYEGPEPLNGQYPCAGTATVELPSTDFELVGDEAVTRTMQGLSATGSSGSASWTVRAKVDRTDTSDIGASAQGQVSGVSPSYPSGYSDVIGGTGNGGTGRAFYFAEGCTRPGYETWLCIQNPSGNDARVQITYMLGNGENFDQEVTVPAHSRGTVSVNSFILEMTDPYQDVSARVVCTNGVDIIVERPMYFSANGITGGHDVVGSSTARKEWYFAEGNTYDWNQEWLCLQNPGSETASVSVDFMLSDGSVETRSYEVPGRRRGTIDVNSAIAPRCDDVSMRVRSSVPVIAERPMYFRYGGKWAGGSNVMGAAAPDTKWYFAEGNTRSWNDMWLCLQNPGEGPAKVRVTYRFVNAPETSATYDVAARSRFTVNVNRGVGPGVDLGVYIESDVPVIAERSMYFDYHESWAGGDTVTGANLPETSWFFAEGCTRYDSQARFDTWICLQNPGDSGTTVTITYMLGTGKVVTKDYELAAASRLTVDVNRDVGYGQDVSAQVTSPVPIIAERPMYFSVRGKTGGHDVMGY